MAAPERFTPVQRNTGAPQAPQKQAGGFPMLPVFMVIIYILYVAVAMIGPKVSSQIADELDPVFPSTYRLVAAGVLFVLFAMVIAWAVFFRKPSREAIPPRTAGPNTPQVKAPPVPPKADASTKFKPVVKPPEPKKEAAPPAKRVEEKKETEPKVIIYPLEVEGGIFGDTYIQLSPEKVLKLRSMVVEPEHLQ
ncbi:MAG: hypothetical protein ACMUHB_06940 [Thermoplasmatota archaeon]